MKNILIYNENEIYKKFVGNNSQIKLIKQKTISQNIKEFISSDLYNQRKMIVLLLLKQNNHEHQYLDLSII